MFRKIGLRTIKTALSIGLGMLFYILLRILDKYTGLYDQPTGFRFSDFFSPFFAGIAAAYSLYPSKKQSIAQAKNRVVASLLGGIVGILLTIGYGLIGKISGNDFFTWPNLGEGFSPWQYILPYTLVAFGVLVVVIFGNILHKESAIFVGILTFISVTINPMGMIVNRYNQTLNFLGEAVFGFNRILSTVVGVLISLCVNFFTLPRKNKNDDLLFVIGIEGMLYKDDDNFKGYMNYKLNSLSDKGINISLFTTRTPTTFMHLFNKINISDPVICMSGAALYDKNKKTYLYQEKIPYDVSKRIDKYLEEENVTPFKNYIINDVAYIYTKSIDNIGEKLYAESKKNAPYCNFVLGEDLDKNDVLYYLIIDTIANVKRIKDNIEKNFSDDVICQIYDVFDNSEIVPELKFIKLYSKKVLELNVLKKYKEEKNYRIVSLTTSNLAEHLKDNSDIKLSTYFEGEDIIACDSYEEMFRKISHIYYSKKYRKKEVE